MIVLDASTALDLILVPHPATAIERTLRGAAVHVPAIFDAEAYAVVRRELRRDRLSQREALRALFHVRRLTAARHAVSPLLLEAFRVRDRFGGYDVFYAVLAHTLGATLVTSDAPLARGCDGYVPCRFIPRQTP